MLRVFKVLVVQRAQPVLSDLPAQQVLLELPEFKALVVQLEALDLLVRLEPQAQPALSVLPVRQE